MSRGNAPTLYLVKSGKISVMNGRVSESAYNKALAEKVKSARKLSPHSPREIADMLGISLDQYYRYESRTPMPPYLIPAFCKITDIKMLNLMRPPGIRAGRALSSSD